MNRNIYNYNKLSTQLEETAEENVIGSENYTTEEIYLKQMR